MLKIKKTNASQHLFVKFAITVVIVSACAWPTFGERSYQGRSRGFGRQSGGNGLWQHHQSPSDNNQLEYGSLQREDEDSGAIQQVNRDEEDFLNWIAPEPEAPEAVTPKGTFIGRKKTVNGKVVYAFTGVPYAKPPTGNLRFRRPEPSEPLAEPLDTTNLPNACPQTVTDIFNDFPGEKVWLPNTNMSEDCLFLNIWVPEAVFNRKETELVPVFFWIFGGGYFSGSNSLDVYNGAELAATQGIVVVNVQYRLGPLGFLYLEPGQGNFGLLDQTLALQWTSQNIEYFGGDPNIITAAGESCGAASVGHLMVSPLSKKYIKRAILSSGLLNQKYALKCVDDLKANSMKLAKYAGCEQKAVPEILECLRKVDSEKLNKLQWKLFKNMLEFPFSPIVDGYFLPEHPDILIKKGKAKRADVIMGTVGDEGTYFILYHYLNYFSHLKPTSVTYDRFVDIMNEIFYDYTEAEREAIIDQYTNWENPEDGYVNQQKIGEALGDAIFVCPHRKFADLWSNRGLGVYYYHLTERFTDNPWGKWMGVMHGDDIPLFFGVSASPTEATANETALINNFMEMVGNFVRDGVPSAKWERYTSEHPVYLDVNATTVSSVSTPNLHGPKAKSCAFWNKILPLISSGEESQNNPSQHQHFQYSVPNHSPVQSCQRAQQSIQGHKKDNCFIAPSPAQEPIITTSTSCRCSVQEGSTTSENHGFMTPPPAIY